MHHGKYCDIADILRLGHCNTIVFVIYNATIISYTVPKKKKNIEWPSLKADHTFVLIDACHDTHLKSSESPFITVSPWEAFL